MTNEDKSKLILELVFNSSLVKGFALMYLIMGLAILSVLFISVLFLDLNTLLIFFIGLSPLGLILIILSAFGLLRAQYGDTLRIYADRIVIPYAPPLKRVTIQIKDIDYYSILNSSISDIGPIIVLKLSKGKETSIPPSYYTNPDRNEKIEITQEKIITALIKCGLKMKKT